jgi:hypothetical protein
MVCRWSAASRRCLPLLALLLPPAPGWAVDELALKAAVAYKLMLFTEWPALVLPAGAPLRVCSASGSPYAEALRELRGQRVADHALEPVELGVDGGRPCHAVLLDRSVRNPAALVQTLEGQPTLVIADELPALPQAAVRLSVNEGRVGFDVDLVQVRRRGLRLSAQLLRLARSVSE